MILICRCAEYGHIADGSLQQVVAEYANEQVVYTDDLCRDAVENPALMADYSHARVCVACHPRAIRALFARQGLTAPAQRDLRSIAPATNSPDLAKIRASKKEWVAWYPTIDQERCVNCLKCIDFCIFGVYKKSADGRAVVTNPMECKTDCPACARMCPQQAIIFPKSGESSIQGAEPTATDTPDTAQEKLQKLRDRRKIKLFKDK